LQILERKIAALPPAPNAESSLNWWSAQDAMTISAATLVLGVLALSAGLEEADAKASRDWTEEP
jgi:hypothetical protein